LTAPAPPGTAWTARLTASSKTAPLAKNSGAAMRTTIVPGALKVPAGASERSDSSGSSSAARMSIAGREARRTMLMSASTNEMMMPGIAPTNSVTRKQTAPMANSKRSSLQSRANSLMPSSGTTATATIAPIAGEGISSSSAVPKTSSRRVPTAVMSDG